MNRKLVVLATVLLSFQWGVSDQAHGADSFERQTPALPTTSSKESAPELAERMPDVQVRNLLVGQLDRDATSGGAANHSLKTSARTSVAGGIHAHASTIRGRMDALFDALLALPRTLQAVTERLAGSSESSNLWRLAAYLAAMLLSGWIAQRVYDFSLRRYRASLTRASAQTFFALAFRRGIDLLLDVGGIAVFGLGALVLFFARWLGDELQRIFVLEVFVAVMIVRLVALVARFLLGRDRDGDRMLPFGDDTTLTLRACAISLAVLYGLTLVIRSLLVTVETDLAAVDVFRIAIWMIGLAIAFATIWRVRRSIADLIRGEMKESRAAAWLADLWPVVAVAYFLALFAGLLGEILVGTEPPVGIGFASVLVIVALPILDFALCRALAAFAQGDKGRSGSAGFLATYQPIFRRGVHIIVVVVGTVAIAGLWQLDLFSMAQHSLGGRIASSMLGTGIVLFAAYLVWGSARMAIDRRLAAEGEQPGDVPSSRLRTLLPILRATILITIVAMTAMSILAALGVDILPLLAGASIVGVAIGFGSQTLVRDIVSGAFFLMDDAFRIGEYIEVGDAKGRVEKINLRSVFLRHHRGALNILPYGEIKRLRNTSRDWFVHVLEFRLTYDTNMLQVKKIVTQIGEELSADPDYAPDLIQSLKSAGVMAAEDSAIVVRVKFTARPTNNSWVVRRIAYDKIIRAFRAAGIRFAHRQVTVNVPARAGASEVALSGAAAVESATDHPNQR